jgi:AraC-like DNA-binding protein
MIDFKLNFSADSESIPYTPSAAFLQLPFYLNVWGYFKAKAGYFTRREGQEDFLLINTIDGNGFLEYRGQRCTLYKNDIFFIDCRELQYYGTGPEGYWEFQWMHFAGSGCRPYFDLINGSGLNIVHLDDTSEITDVMSDIRNTISGTDFQADIKLSMLIMRIMTCLAIRSQKLYAGQYQHYTEIINNAVDYMRNHYDQPLGLSDIASAVHLSPFHFSRIFKGHTSTSPHEYLIRYRIDRSKRLLRDTDMSINEIALAVGFTNANNYIRDFKKLVGTTPSKFRRFWVE